MSKVTFSPDYINVPDSTRVHLTRIDPARNMARFYRLDLQPDLFGAIALLREWGRIGQPGRVREDIFPDHEAALGALRQLATSKLRRGYR